MDSVNNSTFPCNCCRPSKIFSSALELSQHEQVSIQDVTVKQEPNALVEVAESVQTTEIGLTRYKTEDGEWLMCKCCTPGDFFRNQPDLDQHIKNRVNAVLMRIARKGSGNVSNSNVQSKAKTLRSIKPRPTTSGNIPIRPRPMPFVATTLVAESRPIMGQGKSELFIRPMPFVATTMETPVAGSGPIIGQSQPEKMFIIPTPCVATTGEPPISENTPNIALTINQGDDRNLKCVYCEVISKTEGALHEHIAEHWRGDVSRSCPLCDKDFMTISNFVRHHRECLLKNKLNESELKCMYCAESSKTERELYDHIGNHWREDEYRNCPLCKKPFIAVTNLVRHYRKFHSIDLSLKCTYCEETTKTEPELYEHIEKHWSVGKSRVCPLCEKPFLSISNLVRHHSKCHKDETKEKRLKCVYCEVTSKTEQELHEHILNHWRENVERSCPVCDRPFLTISNLVRHHRDYHLLNKSDDKKFKCVYCENTSKTRLELREHIGKHWREDSDHRCPFCQKLFTSISHLLRHHRALHLIQCPYCYEATEDKEKMIEHLSCHKAVHMYYYCKKCKGKFSSGEDLLEHVKSHVKDKFLCDLCERCFREKSELKLHITEIHLRLTKYSCTECPRSYSSQETLRQHMHFNHTDNIPIYVCSECGKQFKMKLLYNDHVLRHEGLTPYACDKCDRQFSNPRQLSSHRKTHQNPSKCSHCPKTFKEAFRLREHERTHVGNPELFHCSFCEKTFTVRRYMERHEKRIHLEERPQCSICKKTFSSTDYLRKHFSAVHEDGGGYGCSVCEKRFSLKKDVEIHEALHRPEKPFKCTRCPYACRNQSNLRKHMKIHSRGNNLETGE